MAKKKSNNPIKWISQIFDLFGELVDLIKTESEEKLEEIKQKVKYYMIIYGMLIVALFFVLIGLVKYLAETYVFPSEGISFMVVGSIMIVLLALYSLIKNA